MTHERRKHGPKGRVLDQAWQRCTEDHDGRRIQLAVLVMRRLWINVGSSDGLIRFELGSRLGKAPSLSPNDRQNAR